MLRFCFTCIFVHHLILTFNSTLISASRNSDSVKEQHNLYKDIKKKIELIKKECGTLCNVDPSTYKPISDDSKFYYVPIKKDVDCKALWNNSIFDEKSKFKESPQRIPKYLRGYFTHNSTLVDIKPYYFDEMTDNILNETFNKWGKFIHIIT